MAAAASLEGITDFPSSMQALIEAGEQGLAAARALVEAAPAQSLATAPKILAPLQRPIRLRDCCLFLEHMEVSAGKIAKAQAKAAGQPEPTPQGPDGTWLNEQFYKQVIYYNADHLHVFGPDDEIHWPVQPGWADYELEWACVVGTSGKDIQQDAARSHIFGFTIFNDWSARDLQFPFMEAKLGPGEAKDFANSFGPCIATLDEFEDPYNLQMTARINGEVWSSGSTGTMHHSWEDALVQFSRGKTLFAGEVIGSGTVLGGCGLELDKALRHGDVVELEIERIGVLRNRVLFSQGA
ncbi:fumarylacetoacetate hydrolase family protein [Sphingobium subterraneum]|uniref:2-keto-4-pentenoate hydratase/2-oxohepta-3-ene-1,7-dioic acid hydratase in catechol pathway n=1 Tax=Sphingobium subterraneum TaxID=627688 RepID=A0A841J376_9SPHN|nr:fumarylacetoacetate hydrolase family protein [Sphingobium subterraneum]MBB6125224.1 2-keto-4-pentenoate hydratase/2-oxohepta-3-ene-1,7-dioic acid hydratase in catechol pathway [Sphingobium subterraneum]